MACKVLWTQAKNLEDAMGLMRRAGIPTWDPAFATMRREHDKVMVGLGKLRPTEVLEVAATRRGILGWAKVGFGLVVTTVRRFVGFSPGELTVFFDIERGWISHYLPEPNLPAVIRAITPAQAEQVLRGDPPPELIKLLETPVVYVGE